MLSHRTLLAAGLACTAALVLNAAAMAEIITKTVEYKLPTGDTARGVAVYDDAADGKRPGILVIPEWWGLNEYPRSRARQLAEMGYVAFVADMYGQGRTTTKADEAGHLAGKAHQFGLARLAAPALAELKKIEHVDAERIAAIGFCFGGSAVADMIKSGAPIHSGVSFHGSLGPDAAPAKGSSAKTPLLVLHGGADPMVPPDAIAGYVQKCIEAGLPISFVSFPTAVHALSNPDADKPGIEGVSYDEQAATASWRIMQQFLAMTIGGGREEHPLEGMLYDGVDSSGDPPD